MGVSKDLMFEELEKEGGEVVAQCDVCGGPVTADRLNEMPWDGGEAAFVICEKCEEEHCD